MLNEVYETVRMLLNVSLRGNFSPSDFNNAVNLAINNIFNSYIFEVNKFVSKANRGNNGVGYEDIPKQLREHLNRFLTESPALTYTGGAFTLPANMDRLDAVYYNGSVEVEQCKDSKEFKMIQNYIQTAPSASYPIYLQYGNTIKVQPATIVSGITAQYIRVPNVAKFTYTVVGGNPLFNPSAVDFVEIDLDSSEFVNVVRLVANSFGLNLSNMEVVQAMNNQEAMEQNEENNIQ